MSPRKILVPHDFSEHSDAALERAVWIAKTAGGEIHLLHACALPVYGLAPYETSPPAEAWEAMREGAKTALAELREKVESRGVPAHAHVTDRLPTTAITETAKEIAADLVVMGTHGRTGITHLLLGSVAERTLRTAECPVLSVKQDQTGPIERILVGTDFSEGAKKAVETAAAWARELSATLHVAHAFDLPVAVITPYEVAIPTDLIQQGRREAEAKLEAVVGALKGKGTEVTSHLLDAPAAPALADCATEIGADLVVTGTRGNTGLKHLVLGSVAEATTRLAPCSVLAVPS